jgi:hypothetical protein
MWRCIWRYVIVEIMLPLLPAVMFLKEARYLELTGGFCGLWFDQLLLVNKQGFQSSLFDKMENADNLIIRRVCFIILFIFIDINMQGPLHY